MSSSKMLSHTRKPPCRVILSDIESISHASGKMPVLVDAGSPTSAYSADV